MTLQGGVDEGGHRHPGHGRRCVRWVERRAAEHTACSRLLDVYEAPGHAVQRTTSLNDSNYNPSLMKVESCVARREHSGS